MSTPAATAIRVRVKQSYSVGPGFLLKRKNMARIRAVSRRIDQTFVGPSALQNYKLEYRLIWNPKKGFAFVEVYYGCGISGFQSTIRKAVIAAAPYCDVFVDEVETPARPASPYYTRDFERSWGVPPALFGRASV